MDIKDVYAQIQVENDGLSNKQEQKINLEKLLKNTQYINKIKQTRSMFEQEMKKLDDSINHYETNLQKFLSVPNAENWKAWSPPDIIKWIISLDGGVYAQYTDKLLKSFSENQMQGEDLKDLTKNDLFLFGVSVFKHRVQLMKHFENLMSGNVNNVQNNNVQTNNVDDEGEN